MKTLIFMNGLGFLGLLAFGVYVIHAGASPWWFVGASLVWIFGSYEVRGAKQ